MTRSAAYGIDAIREALPELRAELKYTNRFRTDLDRLEREYAAAAVRFLEAIVSGDHAAFSTAQDGMAQRFDAVERLRAEAPDVNDRIRQWWRRIEPLGLDGVSARNALAREEYERRIGNRGPAA